MTTDQPQLEAIDFSDSIKRNGVLTMVSTGEARTVADAMEHIKPIVDELKGIRIHDLEILNRPDVPEMTPERLAEVIDTVSEECRMRVVAGTVQSKAEMQALLNASQRIVGIVTPAGIKPFDWVGEIAASGRLAVVNNPGLSDLSIALNDKLGDPPPGQLHHPSRYTVKLSPWSAQSSRLPIFILCVFFWMIC